MISPETCYLRTSQHQVEAEKLLQSFSSRLKKFVSSGQELTASFTTKVKECELLGTKNRLS